MVVEWDDRSSAARDLAMPSGESHGADMFASVTDIPETTTSSESRLSMMDLSPSRERYKSRPLEEKVPIEILAGKKWWYNRVRMDIVMKF